MLISELLKIEKGVTAIIGGGGKTTLMYKLADELKRKGRVIIATSTHINAPTHCPVLIDPNEEEIRTALKSGCVVCAASRAAEKGKRAENKDKQSGAASKAKPQSATSGADSKAEPQSATSSAASPANADAQKLTAPGLSFETLAELCDYVIVEADGAHRLPLKAHAEHEPVIPKSAKLTIRVIGADGFGKKISQTCHRPAIYAKLCGASQDDTVTPELEAKVLEAEALGDIYYLNKTDILEDFGAAEKLAKLVSKPLVAGSLFKEEYKCLQ